MKMLYALDYDSEYANLIVNHNLSYETVTLQEKGLGEVVRLQLTTTKRKAYCQQ